MRLATASFLTAVLAALPAAQAAPKPSTLGVEVVAIEAGRLVVKGSVGRGGQIVALKGTTFHTKSKSNGSFVIRAGFLPANCVVTITAGALSLKALVSDCGPRGTKGEKGERGATGPVGPRGIKGDQGVAGEKGDKGEQGEKGDKGDKGDAGEQGAEGARGPVGQTGQRGLTGLRGLQGPQGPRGATGPKGDTGSFGGKVMFGVARATGGLLEDNGITSVSRVSTGFYVVKFDRSIEGCALQASLRTFSTASAISIAKIGGNREASVQTRGILDSDAAFNVLAICL